MSCAGRYIQEKNKVKKRLWKGVKKLRKIYGWKLHSVWLAGSCAKDYPNLKGEYGDIDLYAVTYTRKGQYVQPDYYDDLPFIDYGHLWIVSIVYPKRLLNSPLYHYPTKQFKKYAVRLI